MKPLHSTLVMLHRCRCCSSRYSKSNNAGSSKKGNSAARQKAQAELRKELRG